LLWVGKKDKNQFSPDFLGSFHSLENEKQQSGSDDAELKVCRNVPRVNHALQVAADVVIDEQQIGPHVCPACLSLKHSELIPKWPVVEAMNPCGVKQHEKQKDRHKSNYAVYDAFDKHHKVFGLVLVNVIEQHHAVEEAADEEE
jgi:hypothetical protein